MRVERQTIRKILLQGSTLGLALIIILTGCTRQPVADITPVSEQKDGYALWTYEGDACSYAAEKTELVTAHADDNGNIRKITDAVELRDINGKNTIRDVTGLKDLTNKDGNEEMDLRGMDLYIQNLGEDVRYEGTGTEALPVGLHIRYYLNGKEISPEKIKGRSGRVKIEYSLENYTEQTIEAEGRCYEMAVPYIAVTLVTLPEEGVRNVEVRDCKESSLGGQEVVLGYTMPGLSDNLEQLSLDKAADIDIPESFSVSMDAENFEPVFSTTIVTSGLLEEDLDLKDLDEIAEDLTDLADATGTLVDAAGEIGSGMSKYGKYQEQFVKGVDGLSEGAGQLQEGISALDDSKEELLNGAKGVSDGIQGFIDGVGLVRKNWNDLDWTGEENRMTDTAREQAREEILEQLKDKVDEETAAAIADQVCSRIDLSGATDGIREAGDQSYGTIASQADQLLKASRQYTEGVKEYNSGIGELRKGAGKLKDGAGKLAKGGHRLSKGYATLLKGIGEYKKGIQKFYDEGILKLKDLGKEDIPELKGFLRAMEKASQGSQTYSGLEVHQKGHVTFIIETD